MFLGDRSKGLYAKPLECDSSHLQTPPRVGRSAALTTALKTGLSLGKEAECQT